MNDKNEGFMNFVEVARSFAAQAADDDFVILDKISYLTGKTRDEVMEFRFTSGFSLEYILAAVEQCGVLDPSAIEMAMAMRVIGSTPFDFEDLKETLAGLRKILNNAL